MSGDVAPSVPKPRGKGRNTSRKGSSAENFVANWLQNRGWLVGSRRHIGGAGDLLAVWPGFYVAKAIWIADEIERPDGRIWLIEVKNSNSVWRDFTRADRQEMREQELPPESEHFCVNVRGSGKNRELTWYGEKDWP